MKNYRHEELLWDNPQIEVEHDVMEAEVEEYDDVRFSSMIVNKLNNSE